MIEKNFQRKIVPYLDGTLSKDEANEFEAYVATHPEFQAEIRSKRDELELLKSQMPAIEISPESYDSISREMKASVFNLLKEEPKSFFDSLRIRWEEWVNR